MRTRLNHNGTLTIWLSAAELRAMEYNQLSIYRTPGGSEQYFARHRHFADDVFVADPRDFLAALGLDSSDGLDETDTIKLTVKL